jgi:hypothetical protein
MVLASIQSQYQKVKAFYKKYESFFMPALIIWGFIYHYITFKVIPITDVLYLVFGYLALATMTIIFMHVYDQGLITHRLRYVRLFVPLLLQFTIGSMIGGVFIFYWFSGSIYVSWPFIVLVVVLIISMEFYKHYLEHPVVQFALYTFSAFLLLAVALPYFFTSISSVFFMLAGWISLFLVFGLVALLRRSPAIKDRMYRIITACVLVFLTMNVFYFYNLIPPVPLSIRDAGVYHSVSRSGNDYVVEGEPRTLVQKLIYPNTIHLGPEERAYVYSSIYSPTDLDINIVHEWKYFDPGQRRWLSMSKISFHLVGGRQEGYRGYSYRTNLQAGTWRVFVETPGGQVLGRYEFDVEQVSQPPVLVQEIK